MGGGAWTHATPLYSQCLISNQPAISRLRTGLDHVCEGVTRRLPPPLGFWVSGVLVHLSHPDPKKMKLVLMDHLSSCVVVDPFSTQGHVHLLVVAFFWCVASFTGAMYQLNAINVSPHSETFGGLQGPVWCWFKRGGGSLRRGRGVHKSPVDLPSDFLSHHFFSGDTVASFHAVF